MLVADNGSTDGTLEYLSSLDWIELFTRGSGRTAMSHGAALDWLAQNVVTRYFLTLDSDVVFLRRGWLSDLLEIRRQADAVAVGEYEPGFGAYRPRLAPYLLLLDTERFRAVSISFEPCAVIRDPAEARRWRSRGNTEHMSYSELRRYRSATFYSTGAMLFEGIVETRMRWVDTPLPVRLKYQHLAHMSWAAAEPSFAGAHRAKLSQVRALLKGS
jgi:hypothetical protein